MTVLVPSQLFFANRFLYLPESFLDCYRPENDLELSTKKMTEVIYCSILTFTVERYIAIVASPLSTKDCSTGKTKVIIVLLWLMVIAYCCPWLPLTEVKSSDPFELDILHC